MYITGSELSDEVVSPNKKEIDIPVISVMGLGELR